MATRQEHFVVFYSPGTLFSESTTKTISAWNPTEALRLASNVKERHGAIPFGFQFETRIVADPIPDGQGGELRVEPKTVRTSGMFFIAGQPRLFTELLDDRENHILKSNMRANDWPIVVETCRGYRETHPFKEEDAIITEQGTIIHCGKEAEFVAYRKRILEQWKLEREAERIRWQQDAVRTPQ